MKKILFSALIAISLFSSAFARDNKPVGNRVQDAFTTEFTSATEVNWTARPQFAIASFKMDGKNMEAFYNYSGEMIGLTNTVAYEALPAKAKNCITKKYADYAIKQTLHFQNNEENAYYVSAESSTKKLILKVVNNHVSVYSKKNK